MTKIVIHIAGCHHHLPFQEQGRPCSWTCFTPVWWPLVKRESTSIPSCWTFTKVSIMPLTVTGSFYLILYIFSFLFCPDVPPEIVFHYVCRWSHCFILYCFRSRVCRCRCSLTHAWHLCTAYRDSPEETKPSETNAGETVHLWPHIAGCHGDKQWNLPALLWRVSGEQLYLLPVGFFSAPKKYQNVL